MVGLENDSILRAVGYTSTSPGNMPDSADTTVIGSLPPTYSAEDIYGERSFLSTLTSRETGDHTRDLTGNPVYHGGVLLCFLAFCTIIYFYRNQILEGVNILRGSAYTEKTLGEHSRVFDSFLNCTIALGLVITGITGLRFMDMAGIMPWDERIIPWMVPIAASAAFALWGFQYILLKAAGAVTLTTPFTARLYYLRRILFSLFTISVAPFFMVFTLSGGNASHVFGWTIIIISALIALLSVIRTFMLFIQQNLSILHWFLYLCGVEIFPVSFLILMAGKIF